MSGSHASDDVLIADNESGGVVLRLRGGVYFELDRSATEVLRLTQSLGQRGRPQRWQHGMASLALVT